MDNGVAICACGHPVSRHTLAETEYARCDGVMSGHSACHCSGGVRPVFLAGIVDNSVGPGNRAWKYFKREYRISPNGAYDTLNRAVEKTMADELQTGSWVPGECNRCGEWWEGAFVGYGSQERDSEGDVVLNVELLCGICNYEETHR